MGAGGVCALQCCREVVAKSVACFLALSVDALSFAWGSAPLLRARDTPLHNIEKPDRKLRVM